MARSSEVYRGEALAERLGIHLPEVDLTRWAWRNPMITYDYINGNLIIVLEATVRNVETGEFGPLVQRRMISQHELDRLNFEQTQAMLLQYIQIMLTDMLVHELTECLYIDGERVCKEPHPESKPFLITGITEEKKEPTK